MSDNIDLAIARLANHDCIAKIAHAAVNLDLLVQKLLESADVKDFIRGGLRGVDGELCLYHLVIARDE